MITGYQAEDLFYNLFNEKEISSSTREENMFKHIDFFVNGTSYEVKSEKKLNRWDAEATDGIIWLEAKNVRGDRGWLFGEADKIAFLSSDKFLIVDRKELVKFVKSFVGITPIKDYKGYKVWYRRRDRQDAVTYVYLKDILHLVEKEYLLS
jgi:hypothetical protein